MSRVLLTIEYDGTAYAGWQRQLNGLSVQQVLEERLSALCGEEIRVTGASRTDAGVHARGQRVHFDTSCRIPPEKVPFALNTMLPPDIRVTEGRAVPDGFHARFLSCGKRYTYRILNTRHASALLRDLYLHIPVPLDPEPMRAACADLLGTHDFAAFQAAGGTAKTTVRTITEAQLSRDGDRFGFTVYGNAFLYNMVRIIVGTLIEIGHGKREPDAFRRAFASLDRLDLGVTAPPHGLELTRVDYPEAAFTDPASIRWHKEDP
ncbi:MAG: tRNA pseudouridine(38-40) synthase TruA [Clostridia bacterium]|nr:tRNA pseudouridine(38-40) synthase TruA [Clostridia bacterium]